MNIRVLFLFILSLVPFAAFSQLSGSYSINPNGSGNRYFPTLDSAVKALQNQGMAASVSLEFAIGNHLPGGVSKVVHLASIGTDSSKSLTIKSSGGGHLTNFKGHIEIKDEKWINIEDLSFTPDTIADIIRIFHTKKVNINRVIVSGIYKNSGARIALIECRRIIATNNQFLNANSGFAIYGTNSYNGVYKDSTEYVKMNNNVGFGNSTTMNLNNCDTVLFSNNTIENSSASGGAVYFYGGRYLKVLNNKINALSTSNILSIYRFQGDSTTKALIANNFFYNSHPDAYSANVAYLYLNDHLDLFYNTFKLNSNGSNSKVINSISNDSLRLKNNIFDSDSSDILYLSNTAITQSNYNVYNTKKANYISGLSGVSDIFTWNTQNGKETNGSQFNPGLEPSNNLFPSNDSIIGIASPVSEVLTDIFGTQRNATNPTPGAFEWVKRNNDALVSIYDSLDCKNLNAIKALIKNTGKNTISSFTLNVSVDSSKIIINKPIFNWTGVLAPGNSIDTIVGYHNWEFNKKYIKLISVSSVNGGPDSVQVNDSSSVEFQAGSLKDTVNIGISQHFSKLSEAILNYKSFGHCGNVTFFLTDASYSDTVDFDIYTGTDTLFIVGDSMAHFTNSYFDIKNSPNIVWRNSSFRQHPSKTIFTDWSNGHVSLTNCHFDSKKNTYVHYYVRSNTNLFINNCSFVSGVSAVSSSVTINTLNIKDSYFEIDAFLPVLNLRLVNDFNMTGCAINSKGESSILNVRAGNKFNINKCHFKHSSKSLTQGLAILGQYSSSYRDLLNISDNIFDIQTKEYFSNGIYLQSCDSIQMFHNTIKVNSLSKQGTAVRINASQGFSFKNNIVLTNDSVVSLNTSLYSPSLIKNNVYHSDGLMRFVVSGSTFNSLSSYQSSTFADSSSLNIDPKLSANYITNTSALNTGKFNPLFNSDFYGENRSLSKTDAGAIQSDSLGLDLEVSNIFKPIGCPGLDSVFCEIKNTGNTAITSFSLNVFADTGTGNKSIQTIPFTNLLAVGQSDTVFMGMLPFKQILGTPVSATVALVNGGIDSLSANDSIGVVLITSLSGKLTFDATDTSADYNDISFLIELLEDRPICDTLFVSILDSLSFPNMPIRTLPGGVLQIEGHTNQSTLFFPSGYTRYVYNQSPIIFNNLKLSNNYVYTRQITLLPFNDVAFNNCLFVGNMLELGGNLNTTNSMNVVITNSVFTGGKGNVAINKNQASTGRFYKTLIIENNEFYGYSKICELSISDTLSFKNNYALLDTTAWPSPANQNSISLSSNYGEVIKNKIYSNGIVYFDGNPNNSSWTIANNEVVSFHTPIGGFSRTLYLSDFKKGLIANNSVVQYNNANGSFSSYALAIYNCDSSEIRNNIILNHAKNTNGTYALYNSNSANTTYSNNCYFSGDSTRFKQQSTNYTGLSSWKTQTGDTNSFISDIQFVNEIDLTPYSLEIDSSAIPIASISTDVEGNTRNASFPDVGAHEIDEVDRDASLISWNIGDNCNDTIHPFVKVQNFGSSIISSLDIVFKYGGPNDTTLNSFSGLSIPFGIDTILYLSSLPISHNNEYQFTVYSKNVNGFSDQRTFNDTLYQTKTIRTPLNGVYTIGSTGDFISLKAFADSLHLNGVCNSVTGYMIDSVYENDYFNLADINGTSTNNFIHLTKAPSLNQTPIISTDRYIKIKNVTDLIIDSVSFIFTSNQGVSLLEKVWNVEFINNEFRNENNFNQLITSVNHITFNPNIGDSIKSFTFSQNKVVGGGKMLYGLNPSNGILSYRNITIEDNVVDSCISFLNIRYGGNLNINNNKFNAANTTHRNEVCEIYLSDSVTLSGNYFVDKYNDNSTSTRTFLLIRSNADISYFKVYNNYLYSKQAKTYMVFWNGPDSLQFYNNTVHSDYDGAISINATPFFHSTQNNPNFIDIKNNLFISRNSLGPVMSVTGINTNVSIDNNIYYSDALSKFRHSTNYYDFASWKSNTLLDSNSYFENPVFFSSGHPAHNAINGDSNSSVIPFISEDIYGIKRDSVNPDIGCVEYDFIENAISISELSLSDACSGSSNIQLVVKNLGKDTLNSFELQYWDSAGTRGKSVLYSSMGLSSFQDTLVNLDTITLNLGDSFNLSVTPVNASGSPVLSAFKDTLNSSLFTALKGRYTVGLGQSFTTVNEAVKNLEKRGICGPVVLKLTDSIYNENVTLAYIPGQDSSNKVTFIGSDYSGRYSEIKGPQAFLIKNTGSFLFDSLNITGEGARTIEVIDTVGSLVFNNCNFNNTTLGLNSFGIYLYSGSYSFDSLVVANSSFKGANSGIYLNGNSLDSIEYVKIDSNTFTSATANGVFLNRVKHIEISNNQFDDENVTTFYRDYSFIYLNQFGHAKIERNILTSKHYGVIGISANNAKIRLDSSKSALEISNNIVYTNDNSYAIRIGHVYYTKTHNNTFRTDVNSTNSPVQLYYTKNLSLVNNIISGGTSSIRAYGSITPSDSLYSDYNAYSPNATFISGSTGNMNFQTWNSTYGLDSNSLHFNVNFNDSFDLHTNDFRLSRKGKVLSNPLIDIDGDLRTSPPSIGADRVDTLQLDLAILDVYKKGSCNGFDTIKAVIANFGKTPITQSKIELVISVSDTSWVYKDTLVWNSSLLIGLNDTVSLSYYNFNRIGSYTLTANLLEINLGPDSNAFNNTHITDDLYTPLNGTYLVDAINGDWKNLNAFSAHISSVGVCGPTTIQIDSLLNNFVFTLNSIEGSSLTNTVTIESKDPLNPIELNATQYSSLYINGADNVTFKDINIRGYSPNGIGNNLIYLNGVVSNLTFLNMKCIVAPNSNSFYYGIRRSVSNGKLTGLTLNNIEFSGANYAINLEALSNLRSRNITIENCNISQAKYDGIKIDNAVNLKIKSNLINTIVNGKGLTIDGCDTVQITKNNVIASGSDALRLLYINDNDSLRAEINNNFFVGNLYFIGLKYCDFNYNSVKTPGYVLGSNSSAGGGYNNQFQNNIFVFDNSSGPYANISGAFTNSKVDNNVYWNLADSTWTLNSWQNLHQLDSNSYVINPQYFSATDLHIFNDSLDSLGANIPLIDDIDGELRATGYFTPGADFRVVLPLDLSNLGLLSNIICEDTIPLEFKVLNQGLDTVYNYDLVWMVDSSGSIIFRDTINVIDTIPFGSTSLPKSDPHFFTQNSATKLYSYTINVNGMVDMNLENDSSSESLSFAAKPNIIWNSFSSTIPTQICETQSFYSLSVNPTYGYFDSNYVDQYRRLIPDALPVGPNKLLYTVKYSANCYAKKWSNTFIILDAPEFDSIAPPKSYCLNDPMDTLKLFSPDTGYYIGAGIHNGSVFNPSTSGPGTRRFSYNMYNTTSGCGRTKYFDITVHGLPKLTYNSTQRFCETDADTLRGVAPKGGTYSGTGISAGNLFRPWVTGPGTSRFLYSYTDTNGCSNSMDSIILVNKMPNTPILVGDTFFCQNDPITPMTVSGSSGSTFIWFDWVKGLGTGTTKTLSFDGSTHQVTVKAQNGACASEFDTLIVKMVQGPNTQISGNDRWECENTPIDFTAATFPSGGALTYWYSGVDTINPIDSGTTYTAPRKPVQTTIWSKSTKDGCFGNIDSKSLQIDSLPIVDLGPDRELCGATLELFNSNLLSDYGWNTGETTSSIKISSTGIYWLGSFNRKCYARDSVLIKPCTVGLEENKLTDKFSVYPNPVSSNSNIVLSISENYLRGITQLEITDMGGRVVLRKSISFENELDYSISTKSWSSGKYTISLRHSQGVAILPFIIND